MKDFVNVGLLGAGTVGGGVLKVLEKNAEKIAKEVGKPVRITKVLDRHVDRLKQEYGDKYIFTDNADEAKRQGRATAICWRRESKRTPTRRS